MLTARKMSRGVVLGFAALFGISASAESMTTTHPDEASEAQNQIQTPPQSDAEDVNQQAGTMGNQPPGSHYSTYSLATPRPSGGAAGVAGGAPSGGSSMEGVTKEENMTNPQGKSGSETTITKKKYKKKKSERPQSGISGESSMPHSMDSGMDTSQD